MGATAAVYASTTALADQVNQYLKATNMKVSQLAQEVNYNRSTLSRYLNGTYNSDASGVEVALSRYMEEHQQHNILTPFQRTIAKRTEFFETEDARGAIGVCQACQQDMRMGIVLGQSGFGKSFTLRQYAKLPRVAYVECNVFMGPRDLVKKIEKALKIPPRPGTVCDHMESIASFFEVNPGYLLIIDEADKLISKYTQQKMEIIRGIFDNAPVGIVLAGERKLQALLDCYLPQTENRTIYFSEMRGLSIREVDDYLSAYDIEPAVLQELRVRACGREKSCFRLLEGTMSAIINELNASGASTITMDVYNRATSNMLIR